MDLFCLCCRHIQEALHAKRAEMPLKSGFP
jgi:hypothetical protein